MRRTNGCCIRKIGFLILLIIQYGTALAKETEKDFAKCQEMARKYSTWLLEKADKAELSHRKEIDEMLAKQVKGHSDVEGETSRLLKVIDRLTSKLNQDEYRRALVDGATENVLTAENDDDFQCWKANNVRKAFRKNLERYEESLKEIERVTKERLGIENLRSDEGLVVILFYARGRAERVIIDRMGALGGGITFGPVWDGDYFRVLKAKAGTYRWHSVTNKFFRSRVISHLKKSELDFTVEAGKLNYVGAFLYRTEGFFRYRTEVFDRASVLLSLLEDQYPELLDSIELRNGLNSENRFIQFYLNEKRAIRSGDDGA